MNNFGPDSVHVVRCMDLLPGPLSSKHVSPHFAAAFAASYLRDKKELVSNLKFFHSLQYSETARQHT